MPESKTRICVLAEGGPQPLGWAWWPQGKLCSPNAQSEREGSLFLLCPWKTPSFPPSFPSGWLWSWQRSKCTVYTLIGLLSEGINSKSHCQASLRKKKTYSTQIWSTILFGPSCFWEKFLYCFQRGHQHPSHPVGTSCMVKPPVHRTLHVLRKFWK